MQAPFDSRRPLRERASTGGPRAWRQARRAARGVLAVALVLLAAAPGRGDDATVQPTRDGTAMLVSRDVGSERWTITYDLLRRTVTGNVSFPEGGAPLFVWCDQIARTVDPSTGRVDLTFSCFGAEGCPVTPCSPALWTFIRDVTLPQAFFFPRSPTAPTPTPRPTRTAVPTPAPTGPQPTPGPLDELLGTWRFETSIASLVLDHYRFERVVTLAGVPFIAGTDLDDGGAIVAADLSALGAVIELTEPLPFEFALLDPGVSMCDLFVFNRTMPDRVQGSDFLTMVENNTCKGFVDGVPNPMTGFRTSTAVSGDEVGASTPPAAALVEREALRTSEAFSSAGTAAVDQPGSGYPAVLRVLERALARGRR